MEWIEYVSDASTAGRIAAIDRFLAEWYAPWSPKFRLPVPDDVFSKLPRALGWWYTTHGARPGIITFNVLIAPTDEWLPGPNDPPLGRRRKFLAENQGVYVWAYSLGSEDPAVWVRLNEKGGRWVKEGERLSGFLLQLLLWEAKGPVSTSATWIDRPAYRRLTAELGRLPVSPWHWPGWKTEFFARDDLVAIGYPDEGRFHVDIKAKSRKLTDELRRLIPEDHWDNW